jgi:hypothetical protein
MNTQYRLSLRGADTGRGEADRQIRGGGWTTGQEQRTEKERKQKKKPQKFSLLNIRYRFVAIYVTKHTYKEQIFYFYFKSLGCFCI